MKKVTLYIIALTLMVSVNSCSELNPGGTATQNYSGDWWVLLLGDDGDGNFVDVWGAGYNLLSTYNTAANVPDKMFVDFDWWPFKGVVDLDQTANLFEGTDVQSVNPSYDITANIVGGTIIKNAATTSGGNVSDSIYMEIEFSDDPGYIYKLAGYRRTGFIEDEH